MLDEKHNQTSYIEHKASGAVSIYFVGITGAIKDNLAKQLQKLVLKKYTDRKREIEPTRRNKNITDVEINTQLKRNPAISLEPM